ncbi:DUF2029 domain-containing protein [Nakamurella silvestris]|nr:DUF2029 domain-containing protein [Nakamurella silvestris]
MDTARRFRWVTSWAHRDLRQLPQAQRRKALLTGVAILLAVIVFCFTVYQLFMAHHSQFDLKIYFNAINMWTDGGNLYDYAQPDPVNGMLGFTYPPAAALFMSPMGSMALTTVVVLTFLAIMSATVVWVAILLRERLSLPRPQFLLVVGMVTAVAFCFQPMAQNISFGQINIFLALLISIDLLVLDRRNSRWTGIGIGIAMAVKVIPGIFLIYLIAARRWRALAVALGSAAAVTLFAAIFEPKETWQYFSSLLWESSRVGVPDNTSNQSLNGIIARIWAPLPPDRMVWVLLSAAVLVLTYRRARVALSAGDRLAAMTLFGLLGVLVSPVSWIHHAVWVLPCGLVLVSSLWANRPMSLGSPTHLALQPPRSPKEVTRWWYLLAFTVVGVLVWYFDTRSFFGLRGSDYTGAGPIAIIGGSLQTIWMVVAVAVLPIRRRGLRPQAEVPRLVGEPSVERT